MFTSLSDAGVAALMLQAGCEGAALNVKINLGSLSDANFIAQTKTRVEQYRLSLETITSDIHASVNNPIYHNRYKSAATSDANNLYKGQI